MGTVSRVHTFSSGAILTAAQLNNEFDNLLTSSAINGGLDATNLGVTAGQATASKALVVDSSRNLADGTAGNRINNLALSGTFESTGLITATAGITSGSNIVSDTDSTDDLGTTGVRWRNLYVDDVTVTNNVSIGGTLTLTGGLTLNGNVAIGDSASDTLTVNSTITSNLIFTDATYDIGASGATRPRDLHLSRNALMGGTLGVTGLLTATAGVTSGSNIVSDTDSTDNLGTTSVRWANLYVDSIGDTGQALAITAGSNNVNVTAGTLALTGAQTISSTLGVTGLITASGGVSGALTGNVTGNISGNVTGGTISGTTGSFSGDVTLSKDAPYLIMTDSGTGGGTSKIAVDAVGSNYGFYFQADGATNHVILESNGDFKVDADTLFVDASADSVGIGTSSPQRPLHIDGAEGVARFTSTASGNNGLEVGIGTSSQAFIWQAENSYLQFATNNAEAMRITSAGLVKVLSDGLAINGQNTSHEANSLHIGQEGSGLAQFRAYGPDASTRGSIEFVNDSSDGSDFVRAMTIENGEVGIGTASPYMNAVVGVAPTVAATTIDETSDLAGAFVIGNNVGSNFGDRIPLIFNVSGASSHNISAAIMGEREGASWDSALSFWTNNVFDGVKTDTIQEKMRLTSDGYLGINSATPSALLHVSQGGSYPTMTGNTHAIIGNTSSGSAISRAAIMAGATTGFSVLDFGDTDASNAGGITYSHQYDRLSLCAGAGATRASIDSDGLKFGTATAGANALDSYEEGTFSPALGSGSASYSEQLGSYTKIGNVVFINVSLTWTGGPTSGNLVIGTLPFTSSSTLQSYSPLGQVATNSLTVSGYEIAGYIHTSSTTIQFSNLTSGGSSSNKTYEAAGTIRITGHYFV